MIHRYFDSHCHLDKTIEKMGFDITLGLAQDSLKFPTGFDGCISIPSDNLNTFDKLMDINLPNVYYAVGLHPLRAEYYNNDYERKLKDFYLNHPKTKALGEIGLDRYKGNSTINIQKDVFIKQIEIALSRKLPIVIHTRHADDDTLDILKSFMPKNHTFHIHYFSGSLKFAENVLMNWPNAYFGITGKILYPQSLHIKEICKLIPLNHLLAETDAPYLSPPQYQQRFTTPALIPTILDEIAKTKEISKEETYQQIRENCRIVYKV